MRCNGATPPPWALLVLLARPAVSSVVGCCAPYGATRGLLGARPGSTERWAEKAPAGVHSGVVAITFHSSDDLVQRLRGGDQQVVFLVGAALTMPVGGKPGVPGVDAMIDLVRAHVGAPKGPGGAARAAAKQALLTLEDALAQAADGGARYQIAFEQLKALVDGAASVNAVIRQAVLAARTAPTDVDLADPDALARLEASADGWHLGPAVKALGLLVARHPRRFGRAALTTNFDPLIELAIRAAGGQAHAIAQLGDGALPTPDPTVTSVVHLHGLWRTDSLHTPGALTVDRAVLRRALARLYDKVTLVVIAYGGWDDVLTAALAELASTSGAEPDIVWCFYEADPRKIEARNADLLALFRRFGERVACYAGVDCNVVLPRLREAVDGEGELLGREATCDELYDALDSDHAVEVIGEWHMKRSRLLKWIQRQAPRGTPTALLNARELASPTPEALVRRIADAVGRLTEMEDELHRFRSVPTSEDATRALGRLRGVWILIDDADALARPGHQFTEAFFAELRARVQARDIRWISVGRAPLGPLFLGHGLTSQFLNDARLIYAGGLERGVVERALGARLGARAPAALALTGTLPRLVYRLCEAEWGDVDATLAGLPAWAEGMCELWWDRSPAEQALLRRIAAGATALDTRERSDAADLCHRGLLVETPTGFALNGKVWEDYVRARP